MSIWNYCPNCGKRLAPNEEFCENCGMETLCESSDEVYIFQPPIHNIGFFNLKINFSPYIETKYDFKYEICSCGYINDITNEYCYNCGTQRIATSLIDRIKRVDAPVWNIDDFVRDNSKIICECGAVNGMDDEYCDMCGRKLHEDSDFDENFSNFSLEYEHPIFCYCGQENDENSQFCRNCGVPLDSFGKLNDIKKLCVCSTLNDSTADYCVECGNNLNEETVEIICICGTRNPISARFCLSCERPLNSERIIKTKVVCSCGKIMDFDSEFCPNCGKKIKSAIQRKKHLSNGVNSVKKIWRGI